MKKNNLQCHYFILATALLLFLINGCSEYVDPIESGTFTDKEGNVYHTVSICDQVWLIENLNVTKFRNGDAIPKVTDNATWRAMTTGAYCYYNNDSTAYAATYGKLYNWYAVNDPRGFAPEGWHIPSDFEWTTLGSCLGGDSVAGGAMKEIGTAHWNSPNTGATNLSGFTGLPGGYRDVNGIFNNVSNSAYWWSFIEYDASVAWTLSLDYSVDDLFKYSNDPRLGFSVRCLKD